MSRALLAVSWRVVAQGTVLLPAATAAVLTVAAAPLVDGAHAHELRLGVACLLACALAATADDPAAEVAAAAPHPRWARCSARLALGFALAVPVVLSLAIVERSAPAPPMPGAGLQLLALLLVGPAAGFAVWAWHDAAQPAYAAMVAVLCVSLALWVLPTEWSVVSTQPWGPPWQAALIRWSALAVLGAAVVAAAWRDPYTARSRAPHRRRRSRR
jgi:hypothetical protein